MLTCLLYIGAGTGRLTMEGPNLQNMQREGGLRGVFRASAGRRLLSADFSQVSVGRSRLCLSVSKTQFRLAG